MKPVICPIERLRFRRFAAGGTTTHRFDAHRCAGKFSCPIGNIWRVANALEMHRGCGSNMCVKKSKSCSRSLKAIRCKRRPCKSRACVGWPGLRFSRPINWSDRASLKPVINAEQCKQCGTSTEVSGVFSTSSEHLSWHQTREEEFQTSSHQ